MKLIFSLLISLVSVLSCLAQKPITKSEYEGNFKGSVSVTNAAFPLVFTVVTETYENGKLVSTETEVNERQSEGVAREKKSITKDGKTLKGYSVMVGFENSTYCSSDGKIWTGPQEFVCPSPDKAQFLRLFGPRTPETAEYTVIDKKIAGKPVKIYREYAIFASRAIGKKDFKETIATIDASGFFIEVSNTEGTLNPRVVTLTRRQSWKPNAKFAPVVAPQ